MNRLEVSGKSKAILGIIICAVSIAGIVGGISFFRNQQAKQASEIKLKSTAYDSSENQWLLDADPIRKTLLLSFDVSANKSKPFSLTSIGEYNARPEAQVTTPGDYTLSVIEDGNPVYVTNISITPEITEEFLDDGTIKATNVTNMSSYSVRIPRYKDGSTYIIRDASGNVVLESTITNVTVHNNEPSYKTLVKE